MPGCMPVSGLRDAGSGVRSLRTDVRGDASEDDLAFVLSGHSGPKV